ncbi:LOB domain-containing protein 19 [Linum grandiflorum]
MMSSSGERGGGGGGGAAPCGACKFLRRKCVKGCIFAPYFDSSDQGTAHFAAVHKVFGASNASKLLMRMPPQHRLDAVVTLCYEALARVRDPVYGCVAHIFTLQHQVVNLQTELAYIQARLANFHGTSTVLEQLSSSHLPPPPQQPHNPTTSYSLIPETTEPAGLGCINNYYNNEYNWSEISSSSNSMYDEEEIDVEEEGKMKDLAREFVARYLPAVRFPKPST